MSLRVGGGFYRSDGTEVWYGLKRSHKMKAFGMLIPRYSVFFSFFLHFFYSIKIINTIIVLNKSQVFCIKEYPDR